MWIKPLKCDSLCSILWNALSHRTARATCWFRISLLLTATYTRWMLADQPPCINILLLCFAKDVLRENVLITWIMFTDNICPLHKVLHFSTAHKLKLNVSSLFKYLTVQDQNPSLTLTKCFVLPKHNHKSTDHALVAKNRYTGLISELLIQG